METALQLALREDATSAGPALVRLYEGTLGDGEGAEARWLSSLMIAPGDPDLRRGYEAFLESREEWRLLHQMYDEWARYVPHMETELLSRQQALVSSRRRPAFG